MAPEGMMNDRYDEIVAWIAGNVLPHERALRDHLRRFGSGEQDIDDIVQEAYLNIVASTDATAIRDGKAYLFTTARTVVLRRVRRERIVRIDQLSEGEVLTIVDDTPDAERRLLARAELQRVRKIISAFPPRCRAVLELRRLEGLSQREVAARLNVPEHTVEQEAMRGLQLLLRELADNADDTTQPKRPGLMRWTRRRGRKP